MSEPRRTTPKDDTMPNFMLVEHESNARILDEGGRHTETIRERSAWDVYNNEAKKVDTELVLDWRESLNSLLLFAAIFAAVLTAFIIDSKQMLELDQMAVMVDVMIFITANLANGTHEPYRRPSFQASPTAITINSLFFASLSTSLVAALASVVALQWVADYDAAMTRGGSSPEDRAKRRHFRHAGMVKWKMEGIIAAIPLCLYCSVLLFFGGLILWMWAIHSIVGAVVAAGAAIAISFYVGTTLIAVAFVSAPFRTPISRGIYSIVHLSFSIQYRIARALNIRSIPAWLKERHRLDTRFSKREDRAVEKQAGLKMNALVWLANQLSVSQDSYERLLLLASELHTRASDHFHSHEFIDAPWFEIFDLLAWKSLRSTNEDIGAKDIRAFEVLMQCYNIPKIREITGLNASMMYTTEETDEKYWSQYCTKPSNHWARTSYSTNPNSLFLLLRDIPLPSTHPDCTIETTIRLSRWRNSPDKSPEALNKIIKHEMALSTSLDGPVAILGRFLRASRNNENTRSRYVPIMERMVHILINEKGGISPASLTLLRRGVESLLITESTNMRANHCLSMPTHYRDGLRTHVSLRSLHYSFTLLLARGLHSLSGAERSRRVKEVITMLWVTPVFHGYLEEDIARARGMESFFDSNKGTLMRWIKNSAGIPHIHEILYHLSAVQKEQPEVGPLWRVANSRTDDDPRLFEVLKEFQELINRGVTAAQHFTLVDLICRDLEFGPPGTFKRWFTVDHLNDLDGHLRDPCLRLLAESIVGVYAEPVPTPFIELDDLRRDSWTRIAAHLMKLYEGTNSPSILRTQASMWPLISDQEEVCERALKIPNLLMHLQRTFSYSIPCSEHYDSDGHLLLHILKIPPSELTLDTQALTTVPMKGRQMEALFIILLYICAGYKRLPSEQPLGDIDPQCLAQIWELANIVMSSQYSILSLLSDVSTARWVYPEHVAALSTCVTKALLLPYDSRSTSIIPPLIRRIMRITDQMCFGRRRTEEERHDATIEAKRAVAKLKTFRAAMKVSGRSNVRLLSCTRASGLFAPAGGWLPAYVE